MNQSATTTKKQRERHVAQMNANFRIEGFAPDAEDLKLQQQYIEGSVSLEDMLAHAREFALNVQRTAK